ncbi:bifunctional folylpolyglutamate synthase/dihydrofolate synthase [Candidatus Woesearchaeota archaeon]|nr:bifunctional folylpolyglutamate synthase/dihydrofolate synthase [Candidatus Woesearchaeota archaeon]
MDYKKILNYLYSLESSKIKLGLENVKSLLNKIGNPEKQLKCIHVAGTNGKGSVCAMLSYALKEAGYKVGLYTSPHLKKFNERIRVNEHFITDREIVDYFLKIKPCITDQSFFEITTAMAFLYFREKNVDFAVLEVGLGGRLDATNVVVPLVSVITNIDMEHTDLLGNTIEKIAFEKAGIIKNNVPVVTGAKGKALKTIKKIAEERNALSYLTKKYPKIKFYHLNGQFQQENKDIALTTIDILKKFYPIKINQNQIINGLKKTQWTGRLQFLSKKVLVDCAHNPSGFEVLKKELNIIKKQRKIKNLVFVVGIQETKDIELMLQIINPLISTIIFTKSKNEKATHPQKLLRIFDKINTNKKIMTKIIFNPKNALTYAKKISGKKDLVVVTGSIYLVGEIG